MAQNLKQYLTPLLLMFNQYVLPELEKKANESKTPLDNLGVNALKSSLVVLKDGEVNKNEVIKESFVLLESVFNVLEEWSNDTDTPWDDVAIKSLRDSVKNISNAFEKLEK
jgi:hypothetical protein